MGNLVAVLFEDGDPVYGRPTARKAKKKTKEISIRQKTPAGLPRALGAKPRFLLIKKAVWRAPPRPFS
jgi:hypothetical protein